MLIDICDTVVGLLTVLLVLILLYFVFAMKKLNQNDNCVFIGLKGALKSISFNRVIYRMETTSVDIIR